MLTSPFECSRDSNSCAAGQGNVASQRPLLRRFATVREPSISHVLRPLSPAAQRQSLRGLEQLPLSSQPNRERTSAPGCSAQLRPVNAGTRSPALQPESRGFLADPVVRKQGSATCITAGNAVLFSDREEDQGLSTLAVVGLVVVVGVVAAAVLLPAVSGAGLGAGLMGAGARVLTNSFGGNSGAQGS